MYLQFVNGDSSVGVKIMRSALSLNSATNSLCVPGQLLGISCVSIAMNKGK
jgi:hypothetical protein